MANYGTVRVKANEHNRAFANDDGIVEEVFEIVQLLRAAKIDGKEKYSRVGVRRVGYVLDNVFYQFEGTGDREIRKAPPHGGAWCY